MRIRKFIELKCSHCKKPVLKEAKEYKRQSKKGRKKFFCNLSCAAKANESLAKNAEFCKNNPQIIKIREAKFRRVNPNARFFYKDEFSPFRYYLRKIQQRLKSKLKKGKQLEFCLTLNDIKEKWDNQNGICPYTGKKMSLVPIKGQTELNQASLDRIDSSKGYIKGNVEFVCLAVNYAKNSFSREQTMAFFQKI